MCSSREVWNIADRAARKSCGDIANGEVMLDCVSDARARTLSAFASVRVDMAGSKEWMMRKTTAILL